MINRLLRPRLVALLLTLLTLAPAVAPAPVQARDFGLGIILGDPTGFTGKVWTAPDRNAIDFGLAWAFGSYFTLYGDYLWHFPRAFGGSSRFVSELNPYVGVGLAAAFATYNNDGLLIINGNKSYRFFGTTGDRFGLGIRIPLGIEWLPARPPIGVFLELAPGIAMVPATSAFFQGGIGARYYF